MTVLPAFALTIDQARVERTVARGETVRIPVTLLNETDHEITVTARAVSAKAKDETGAPIFFEGDDPQSAARWISPFAKKIVIPAGKTYDAEIRASAPSAAFPGTYTAAALWSEAGDAGEAISLSTELATLLVFHVPGAVEEKIQILEFKTGDVRYQQFPIEFSIRVRNGGTVAAVPVGSIVIQKKGGGIVAEIPVNTQGGFLLPQSTRAYSARWSPGARAKFEYPIAWMGAYEAQARIRVGKNTVLTQTTEFTFLPRGAAGAGLTVSGVLIAEMIFWRKKRKKNLKSQK